MTRLGAIPRDRALASAAMGSAAVASAVAATYGLPFWAVTLIVAVPWVLAIRARRGTVFALVEIVLGWMLASVLVMLVADVLPLALDTTTLTAAAAIGLAGSAAWALGPLVAPRSSTPVSVWLASASGAVVWLSTLAVLALTPGRSPISWAIWGDATNNMNETRRLLAEGGLSVGDHLPVVPLVHSVLATSTSPGRAGLSSGDVLEHDLAAQAAVWALLIAATCVLFGAVAARISALNESTPRQLPIVVGAAASLVPLTWPVSGFPLLSGFINTHFVLAIVLAGVLVHFEARQRPLASLTVQACAVLLTVMTWPPMAAVPAALAFFTIVIEWRTLRASRKRALAGPLTFGALTIAAIALFTLPALARTANVPSAAGTVLDLSHNAFVVECILVAGGAAVLLRRNRAASLGLISIVASLAAVLPILILASGSTWSTFSYYPAKLLLFAAVVIGLLGIGLAGFAVGLLPWRVLSRRARTATLAAAMLAAIAGVVLTPVGHAFATGPVFRMLNSEFYGSEEFIERTFEYTDDDVLRLAWRIDGDHEYYSNFILINLSPGASVGAGGLRWIAVAQKPGTVASLCDIARESTLPVIAMTDDPALASEVAAECPEFGITVERR